MKVKYKVTLTNPVKDILKVTDNLSGHGNFTVNKTERGVILKGSYLEEDVETKAYNHSYLGETYNLTEKSKLVLDYVDYDLTDISLLFGLLGKNIKDKAFTDVQKGFKLCTKLNETYRIDRYVEKSTDVFLIKINSQGIISKVFGSIPPYSNKIVLTQLVDSGDTLGYFLVSKPLKLDTDDYLFISNNDLLKLPTGFCRLDNNVVTKNATELVKQELHSIFSSTIKTSLNFSSFISLDGVKLTNYIIKENEKVLLQTIDDVSTFSLANISNNLTLVYEISEDTTLKPVLALVSKDLDLVYTEDDSLYLQLQQADAEFLKRYFIKEYSISLKTTHNEYSIINSDILKVLTDTSEFEGKILKL